MERARRARPETNAWLMLVAFFLIFCGLVAAVCLAGWRYYTTATVEQKGTLVRVHAPAGVSYQNKDSPKSITPNTPCTIPPINEVCQELKEGDRVQAKPEAGYGPVASIVLPNWARIDMWAHPTGADLTLTRYRVSRWTTRLQEVQLTQTSGYARYDLPDKLSQPYEQIDYSVVVTNGVTLGLAPGGSYSIDVPHYDQEHQPALAPSRKPILAEVAVRAGSATVYSPQGSLTVQPGQKVQIDSAKVASAPLPAKWDLIRDGDFSAISTGNDVAWKIYNHLFDSTVTDAEKNGKVKVYPGCRPEVPVFCNASQTTNIAQFWREGNQPKSFGIGMYQDLDLDISEYRSLQFSMWARVTMQSVPGAGIASSECPVTIELWFKQSGPSDDPDVRYICVYQIDPSQPIQLSGNLSGDFTYRSVPPNAWYHLTYDLRDDGLLPDARYLQKIHIYANGHDYISEVTDVSLVASQ